MKSSLTRTRWAAIGAAIAVTFGGGLVMVASAASPASQENSLTIMSAPCRLLDTRTDGDSSAVNLGIRKGFVGPSSQGNTDNNDITVIFDSRARQAGDKFSLKYGATDKRPIMGRCDAAFAMDGDLENATYDVVTGLLLNVTTIGANASTGLSQNFSSNGYITVYPWKKLCAEATGATCTTATGAGVQNRPQFSVLNPVAGLSTVHNNVTVQLAPISDGVEPPNVACFSGTDWGNSSCQYYNGVAGDGNRLKAFRLYNANGNVHVIIDVLGYYTSSPGVG